MVATAPSTQAVDDAKAIDPHAQSVRGLRRLLVRAVHAPLAAAIAIGALATCVYVIAYPFTVVHYPPITDLPFHGSAISILRHYFDPRWHFREQFGLHFVEAPYWAMHGLGALLALVVPIVWATKLASIVLLALLPTGLAVMFHGMRKSPLLGMLGLPFVWNSLTHWGFINFMGAIGLMALVIGLAFMVVDRSTHGRQLGLALALLAVFATHIFRFPFALAAVLGVGLVMYPATRRFKPLLLPIVPSLLALAAWRLTRAKELSAEGMAPLRIHWARLHEVPGLLFGSFVGPEEHRLANVMYETVGLLAILCVVGFMVERRWRTWNRRQWTWSISAALVPLCVAAVFLLLFLCLPMEIGIWWYVYPREIVSTLFMAVGVIPDLPRASVVRLVLLGALGYATGGQAFYVAKNYALFDAATEDFRRIVAGIPQAPHLGYMVFDHTGSTRSTTPFIHLPAWVQAEKGGWLSFHFIEWNAWPIRYRRDNPAVPPPTPLRFEWTPERFDIATRGKFFDWFLVRSPYSPEPRFRVDPSIRLVDHVGTWWLLHREAPAAK